MKFLILKEKATFTLLVGVAIFLLGCQPRPVVEKPPSSPKEMAPDFFDLAEADFDSGRYEAAMEKYQRYLEREPKGERSRKALFRMGNYYYKSRLYDKALAVFEKITKDYPDHPDLPRVQYDIAEIYYRLGDYRNSVREASDWIKSFPGNPEMGEVLFLMGRNFHAMGDNSKAFFWWLKAVGSPYIVQGLPERRDEIDAAITSLIRAGNLEELNNMAKYASGDDYAPYIYHRMASIYLEKNMFPEAKDAAMTLIRSTTEQRWISIGREILEKIDREFTVKERAIGCLLPLTGPFAIYGLEALNGIQLGMDIFGNSPEGHPLELIIKDTGGEVEKAVSGVETLAKNEKVMAVIGPLASDSAAAAAKKAQETGLPIITLTQKEGVTEEGEMVFRNFLTPSKEIAVLLDKVMEDYGLERFAILYPDNPYGRYFMERFWDGVEKRGGQVVAVESYKANETDFAIQIKKMVGLYYPRPESVVRKLRAMKTMAMELEIGDTSGTKDNKAVEDEKPEPIADFDAVFIPDNYQQIALIAPQFPFYSIFDTRFLGTSLWQSPELIQTAGDYVQGAIFPTGFFKDNDSDEVKAFVENFIDNFDSEPGILAANGYDTIRFVKRLMDANMISTRKDFQKSLFRNDGFHGVTGEISFDHQGEVEKAPILLTISGNQLRMLP